MRGQCTHVAGAVEEVTGVEICSVQRWRRQDAVEGMLEGQRSHETCGGQQHADDGPSTGAKGEPIAEGDL